MTSISRVAGSTSAGRTTDLRSVKVQENDPGLKASSTAFGFKLSGKATNNGTVASFMKVAVDGHDINLQVRKGDTAATLAKQLRSKLPKGYELRFLQNDRMNPPTLTLGIAKKSGSGGGAKVDFMKLPKSIAANGASGNVSGSLTLDQMPGAGHHAYGMVEVSGTGFADAPPKLNVKSFDVYDKASGEKVATVKNPKVISTGGVWGERKQSYRIDLPAGKVHASKQYVLVANLSINGAKAQAVRTDPMKAQQVF
jgi:hypothetical protein